jgi:hypothetical protein
MKETMWKLMCWISFLQNWAQRTARRSMVINFAVYVVRKGVRLALVGTYLWTGMCVGCLVLTTRMTMMMMPLLLCQVMMVLGIRV